MKKFLVFLVCFLSVGLMSVVSSWAAVGLCSQSLNIVQSSVSNSGEARVLTFTCTAGTGAEVGTFQETAISAFNVNLLKSWYLYFAQTIPGSGGLTALWDYTLKDEYGVDKMGGNGADLSATASQERMPLIATGIGFAKPLKSAWTLAIINNSVSAAPVVIEFWFVQ
jgi:hypothetical protein